MLELNRDNYETETQQSELPVLVDFWGEKCGPCMALMPAVEALEEEYAGQLKLTKVNAYQNRMLCARLRVLGLPTYIVYKNGKEVSRISGEETSISQIKAAVEAALAD